MKLFDSELKVMEVLWEQGETSAKDISALLNKRIGWNKNTTYTVIKKLESKGALRRSEPHFMCAPLVNKKAVQHEQTDELVKKLFDGSKKALFSTLLSDENLTAQDIADLRDLIEKR